MWRRLFLVLFLAFSGAAPAAAQYARGHVRSGEVLPLDRILESIRHSRAGTFYDAQGPFRGSDGRMHYRIKWMTPSGRIVWLDTDAGTGRVLGVEAAGSRRPVWDNGNNHRDRDDDDGRRYNSRRYDGGGSYFGGGRYENRGRDDNRGWSNGRDWGRGGRGGNGRYDRHDDDGDGH